MKEITLAEAARYLGVQPETVRRRMFRHKVKRLTADALHSGALRDALKLTPEIGNRYGRLKVIARDPVKRISATGIEDRHAYWLCECRCGRVTSKRGQSLREGLVASCDSDCPLTPGTRQP